MIELFHAVINSARDKAESDVAQVLKSLQKEKECLGNLVNEYIKGQEANLVNMN